MTKSHFKRVDHLSPTKYHNLRESVQELANQKSGVKQQIVRMIRDVYPELWEKIKRPSRTAFNTWNHRRFFDATKLFKELELPYEGQCKGCGATVKINDGRGAGLKLPEHCSSTCSNNSHTVQAKKRQTHLEKSGYEFALQNPESRQKLRQTMMLRHGVENPMQSPELAIKQQKSALVLKTFTARNGEKHLCRGFEPYVLAYLDNHPLVKRFTTKVGSELLPTVAYIKPSGKKSVYSPDIGVLLKDGRQLVIEVKSGHTLWEYEKLNRAKFKAASHLLPAFWLVVVNEKARKMDWRNQKGITHTCELNH